MRTPTSIARKSQQSDQHQFDALRREGLGLVQELSGGAGRTTTFTIQASRSLSSCATR